MPEHIGVKCFQCDIFQVVQKRKDNKWDCRVCRSKQSVVKIYAISDRASDVRSVIQQYNLQVGKKKETEPPKNTTPSTRVYEEEANELFARLSGKDQSTSRSINAPKSQPKESKWAKYLDEEPEIQDQDDDEDDEPGFVTSLPDKTLERGKRKRRNENDEDDFTTLTKTSRGRQEMQSKGRNVFPNDARSSSSSSTSSYNRNSFSSSTNRNQSQSQIESDEDDVPIMKSVSQKSFVPNFISGSKVPQQQPSQIQLDSTPFPIRNLNQSKSTDHIPNPMSRTSLSVQSKTNPVTESKKEIKTSNPPRVNQNPNANQGSSRWAKYLDDEKDDSEEGDIVFQDSRYEVVQEEYNDD